ncbi:hypothetical protein JOD63_001541 [Microbacterium terrae]|uniref:DUF3043 domain-containing protein n=1 Tax=Microbacterium terrae TaxID=69369 RepID=A0A0M2GX49_9MICO|nr:DUF3043 domain-containing protein [Microbacterium terrae]KJL38160.1 hypothetical protein RS81_03158 [Microbacterium terrae]MBP1077573.1 hypothetical protein [Microbacterium terrae]GLJ99178.1 hypothetical protein GCM10017594_23750 [Microbacterium terrae]
MANNTAPASNDAPSDGTVLNGAPLGKGRPTPSRSEQEAARKRPLVPDTKEAKARAKADLAAQREKARVGMANGDQKYLPARDQGPQRKFVRDFVDSGLHLGEAVMPAMVVVILMTFVPNAAVQYFSFVGLWIFILFVIGDMVITSIRVKRAARAKFGADRLEKGLGWYASMRSVQMRFLRLPKPQVKIGQRPV